MALAFPLWPVVVVLALLGPVGCAARSDTTRSSRDEAAFGPSAMRLHPVFTRFKVFDDRAAPDADPDGIEAMLEFQDSFGDPTKATGRAIFELYEFVPNQPDPRGRRVLNPWVGSLMTNEEQLDRWNRASRTYTFPLRASRLDAGQTYVLAAQFDTPEGQRFFDQIILEGRRDTERRPRVPPPATGPASP
jgi:hypothetical protein